MNNLKTKRLVTITMFSALVIVLQLIATLVNIGGFPITLTLVPIVIAGAIYGPAIGSLMGLIFGVIVSIMVITGADPSGAALFSVHPVIIIFACLLKGVLAGFVSALVYKYSKNKKIGVVVAGALAPITNTFVLYLALIIFFEASLAAMFAAFMSINFILELLINILLAPGILRIIEMKKR